MKKVISFWENTSKTGTVYYTGKLGELELIGFRNTKKQNPKAPDIEFYLKETKPKQNKNTVYAKDIDSNSVFEEFAKEIDITDQLLD